LNYFLPSFPFLIDPTQGHEQQGIRPVPIVSLDKFNALTKVPIVVPITSGGNFARTAGFTVSLVDAGIRTTGFVRCDQPRPLDLLAHQARKLESVPAEIIENVLAKIDVLFNSE